ncbi:MAG: hypothetical protein NTU49_07360 [Gammaproteobacteria bacterium]|nr:hypothetical protein [Gammaproteobacteria bacterium]
MDTVDKMFEKMVKQDRMDYDLFDLNGKNYCPIDGTISLKEMIDHDNALNFYSFVNKVDVKKKFIKNHGQKIAVEFEIFFKKPDANNGPSVICLWIIELSHENKITTIDSYWDVAQFKNQLEKNYPDFLKMFFRKD